MKKFLSEKEYQRYIIDHLVTENGYLERTNADVDRLFALDRELLFRFLEATRGEALTSLKKVFKNKFEETVVGTINAQISASSLLEVLKNGVDVNHTHIDLLYKQPVTGLNPSTVKKYRENIFSVAEEVYATDDERVDLVLFLNGFAIATFELKCNAAGQNYENAIWQYRRDRDPKARLFRFKTGAIVNFAMDLQECYMTTKLCGKETFFLPFNKGRGKGIDSGKGNPVGPDGFGVSYMWETILKKDSLIELLTKFVFVERKTKEMPDGKQKKTETIIFPRFHQIDCIRKLIEDVKENHTSQNYLIQHSAGSGKTYSIAWLAHRLATLHDDQDKVIFDHVVIITDRVVVDRQLQKAVMTLEHKPGFIQIMDAKKKSEDLKAALQGTTKIIASTIQKFRYIMESTHELGKKNFAVIIDEAHSSTAGKNLAGVTGTLGSGADEKPVDLTDFLSKERAGKGKQANVSFFAFTATPKPTTLNLFGKQNASGLYQAFHLYSMKQAVEEGFILDVVGNYTTYETFYKINKTIEEDPQYKHQTAKRKIVRYAILHDENIAQRTEVMIEHFRQSVYPSQRWAKAMVVTGSRVEAVKYLLAFRKYAKEHGYENAHALVAFSGDLSPHEVGLSGEKKVTEASLNGFSESLTPDKFDKGNYQFIIVADKYQTGFDQPKLSAMYVLKKLSGISTVQTLSRLNRIHPPFDKKTFILDFVNDDKSIIDDFKPYFTTTILSNTMTKDLIDEIGDRVWMHNLLNQDEIEACNRLYADTTITSAKRIEQMSAYFSQVQADFDSRQEKERREILSDLRKFVRYYEFFVQVAPYEDVDLQMMYNFLVWLLPYLKIGSPGPGVNLKGKIQATDFCQKKGETISIGMVSDPLVTFDEVEAKFSEDEEKKLSEIIAEINNQTGRTFDNAVAINAILQIKDLLLRNPDLAVSASNNPPSDFAHPFYEEVGKTLQDGWNQNQEFYSLLLNNEALMKEVFGHLMAGIYKDLKEMKKGE